MNKIIVAISLLLLFAGAAFAASETPTGAHYNLNIIGFAQCKMTQDGPDYPDCFKGKAGDIQTSGHTIFVPLKTNWIEDPCVTEGDSGYADPNDVQVFELLKGVRILVSDGADIGVVDRDATDGLAKFTLPDGSYEVYAKAGGKPGGCMDIDTIICYDEVLVEGVLTMVQVDCQPNIGDNDQYVVVGHVDVDRSTGKAHWDNVTDQLLPAATGYGVGDASYFDFFWQIFNNNLRLLQLRFYPVAD